MNTRKILAGIVVLLIAIGGIVYWKHRQPAPETVVRIGHITGTIINLPEDVIKNSDILSKKGVKYQFVDVASSNALYESVVRGDIDITSCLSGLPVFINENKQPGAVKIFSASDITVPEKYDHILVKKDSPIKTVQDLSGKELKYAVFPGTTHTTFSKQYLTNQHIDASKIQFIQMPPQNHVAALESGSVDVLGTYDPMASTALATGKYREIGFSVYANVFDHSPLGVGIVNAKFLAAHPELAKQVAASFEEAYQKMMSDPAVATQAITKAYGVDPSVAQQIPAPAYATQLTYDQAHLQQLTDLMLQLKEIPEKIDISKMAVKL